MFKRREEFSEWQWDLANVQRFLYFISIAAQTFGAQFFVLYLMQNMTVEVKSIQSIAVTLTGVVSAFLVALPWVMRHLEKLLVPVLWAATVLCICCDLLIIQYPIAVIFIMGIGAGLLRAIVQGGFSKMINRCYTKDSKTMFSFLIGQASMLGVCFSSVLVWLFSSTPLQIVVYVDICLCLIDQIACLLRIRYLRKALTEHPDGE